jgi:beta-glucosidase
LSPGPPLGTFQVVKGSIGGEVVQGSGLGFVEHVNVAQRIKDAAAAAASHDVAVVFTRTTPEFESEGRSGQRLALKCQ